MGSCNKWKRHRKVEDKIKLRWGSCKTKTKNEGKLTGLPNSKNKISDPTIVTGNSKIINRFRINIYWLTTPKKQQGRLYYWMKTCITHVLTLSYLCSVCQPILSAEHSWNNLQSWLIPPLIKDTSWVNEPCSLFKTLSVYLRSLYYMYQISLETNNYDY